MWDCFVTYIITNTVRRILGVGVKYILNTQSKTVIGRQGVSFVMVVWKIISFGSVSESAGNKWKMVRATRDSHIEEHSQQSK